MATITAAFKSPLYLLPVSSSPSDPPNQLLRPYSSLSISAIPLCLPSDPTEIPPVADCRSARCGESRMIVHRVLPVPLPTNSAFYSASRKRHHCSSSSNSLSAVHQPRLAVILPGLGNNSGDYLMLQSVLEGYGVKSVVANVSRPDWLRNAAGLLDPNYWKGTLRPRPVLDWYLKRVEAAVKEAKDLVPGRKLSLIGHSAGGWLARVYMEEYGVSDFSLLLTLGTPHTPPPKGVSGVIDQTRGLLDYVDKNCANAVYTPELKYVCIAGRYIQGARIFSEPVEDNQYSSSNYKEEQVAGIATMAETSTSTSTTTTFRARFVGQGYKQVCGRADVWGDGVVPEGSAYLEGALNIHLDGVYHSPVGSDDKLRPWYGSPAVVEQWISHLLDEQHDG